MSSEKATIHTIAKATGLSLATVSRALAGSPSVLPQTRDKVLEAARQFNYVRDRAAVRLKTGKTQVIAFIMDRYDANEPGLKHLLLGLGDAIAGTDYHLIVLPDGRSDDPLATVRYVVERGLADGLVLTHTTPDDERVRYLHGHAFPFITHCRTRLGETLGAALPFVDFANEQFAALAVQGLAQRGRRRLGMLLPAPGSEFREHLATGFLQACQAADVAGDNIAAISLDDGPEAIHAWALAQARSYDGLIVSREAPVLPLLGGLAQQGWQVGSDVDVLVKYSTDLLHYIRDPLLACFEDLHLTGRTLGQGMLSRLAQPQAEVPQILFSPPPLVSFHTRG